MAKIDDGGAAFPEGENGHGEGMRLRDYFAGQALAGLLAWSPHENGCQFKPDEAAVRAYKMADAMLAERKKTNGGGE